MYGLKSWAKPVLSVPKKSSSSSSWAMRNTSEQQGQAPAAVWESNTCQWAQEGGWKTRARNCLEAQTPWGSARMLNVVWFWGLLCHSCGALDSVAPYISALLGTMCSWGWKGALEIIWSKPCAQARPHRANHPGHVQMAFEHLQGWIVSLSAWLQKHFQLAIVGAWCHKCVWA